MLVILGSGSGAVSFGVWLRAHGHRVKVLKITDHSFLGTGAQWASRLADTHRIALLQGLQAGGRPLPLLSNLVICLDQLTAADAVCLGFINAPQLTSLELNSSGSTIGVTGAQGLAPLTGLRKLIVPTQGLGDQGLRIISSSLTNLQHINLHNDGHVTDEGLPFLSKLTSMTALDLQGSISITNHGMLAISKSLPQLQDLNISWCAGVNDWGLAQLCHLSSLSNLTLEATDIRLELVSMTVTDGLQLSNLKCLNLNRCAVEAAGLAAVAENMTGLQCLKLSQNSSLTSFGALRVFKQLSSLTFLDVSAPSALVHPDWHLTALFELTQLQELVAIDLWKAADGDQSTSSLYPPLPTAAEMAVFAVGQGDGQGCLPFVLMLAVLLARGLALVAPRPKLHTLQVSLFEAKDCKRFSVETPAGACGRKLSDVAEVLRENPPPEPKSQGLSALALIQLLLPNFKVLVRLFEVNSNDPQAVISYEGHQGNVTTREYGSRAAVNTVVLHPNQGELISGDQTGHIRVWDLTANACSCELVPEVGTAVRSLTVALDGSMVVAANNHGTCYVWRMLRGTSLTTHFEPLHKLRAHQGYILKCLISPDMQQLATTSSDKTVKLWNLDGFTLDRTLTGHTRWVWDCVFSVDAAYLVTASSDATARLWDLSSGEAIRTYSGHHKAIVCCALNDSAIDGRDADG
eukprot:gene5409-5642_t